MEKRTPAASSADDEAAAPFDPAAERRRVEAAAEAVRREASRPPVLGLILEAGRDRLAEAVDVETGLLYEQLPHISSAAASDEALLLGTLNGTPAAILHGRPALDERNTAREAAFPVRLLATLGVETFLIVGTAVGLRSHLQPADVMLVSDHLNLLGANPLVGPNVEAWGPRFPDMTAPYDAALCAQAQKHAREHNLTLRRGVLAAVPGPVQITSAEGRMLREVGADAVGAGVVPEVIVARHMERRVLALACITDHIEEETVATDEAASKLVPLVREMAGAVGR